MGDANYCAACPEELPEVDSEENYPDIVEVYLGDRVLEGDEINAVKGIPEDELFGTNPPDGRKKENRGKRQDSFPKQVKRSDQAAA